VRPAGRRRVHGLRRRQPTKTSRERDRHRH
jgi:hypothetical protein